jgi:hypothetical protein
MDYQKIGKQFFALAIACENIGAMFMDGDAGEEHEDRPEGCQHPPEYRMPLNTNGKTGFACRACNAVVYPVIVRQEV